MNGHVFGEGAAVGPLMGADGFAKYLVTRPKLCHVLADGLDDSRHVRTGDRVLGSGKPGPHQAKDVGPPAHHVPDVRMERGRANSHQGFIIADRRLVDLSELQIIKRSIPALDNSLHRSLKSRGCAADIRRGRGRLTRAGPGCNEQTTRSPSPDS